jgi:hypothetical protein
MSAATEDRPLSRMLAGEYRAISYRPELVQIAGSVTAAILLQQITYWADKSKWQPFFKFRAPCGHEDYRLGDSWTEELAFTGHEFDSALRKIGVKITKGMSKNDAMEDSLLVYWTDSSRKTWWLLNRRLLEERLGEVYSEVETA